MRSFVHFNMSECGATQQGVLAPTSTERAEPSHCFTVRFLPSACFGKGDLPTPEASESSALAEDIHPAITFNFSLHVK